MRFAAGLIFVVLAAVWTGCGGTESTEREATQPKPAAKPRQAQQKQQQDKPSASQVAEIGRACGRRTGQNINSDAPGSPAFIKCLEDGNVPAALVEAWEKDYR